MSEFPKNKEVSPEELYRSKFELLSRMRDRGASEAERRDVIRDWIDKEQSRIGPSPEDQIKLVIRTVSLERAAGFVEDALANLEDARLNAGNAGFEGLFKRIEEDIDSLAKSEFKEY